VNALIGSWHVARLEVGKLTGQLTATAVLVTCCVAPFVLVAALAIQSGTPSDTLFGRWVHVSGLAIPLVVIGFCGQWVFPALAGLVAADVFASEDHHRTWKLVLGRSRTRGEVFVGKTAVALGFSLLAAALVLASTIVAGSVGVGTQPLLNLSGSLVDHRRGLQLVIASGLSQLPPVLALAATAVALSVMTRNRVVGLAGPVGVGLLAQLVALADLPPDVRVLTPAGAFTSWHGLWVDKPITGPVWIELFASLAVAIAAITVARLVFSRRNLIEH